MIDTVIFDLGNVLVDFRWREFIRDKGYDGEMAVRLGRASVESPVWQEVDRGAWTDEQLINAFIANDPGIEQELRQVFSDVSGILGEREFAIPWIRELHAGGYRAYYLSNYSKQADETHGWIRTMLAEMDGGILSYMEQLIKPDPAIYRLLMERYDLTPENCVFIDDTERNVIAARALGMKGIVMKSREQAVSELRELGIMVEK